MSTLFLQDKLIHQKQAVLQKGFDKEDGVFVRLLDAALASFNVERQAYHGGSFISNHIHRTLKVCSKSICTTQN